MKQLSHVFIFAFATLLPAVFANAQTSAGKTPAVAVAFTPAPLNEHVPKTFKQALREWTWTWTGPQSNTVVTFQDQGKLVTREKQVSYWEIMNASTVRVTNSGTRSLIMLAFDKEFSRFVQMGGGTAPIAGVRGKRVPRYPPRPVARFTFDGTEPETGADIRNVQKHAGVLDLAGIYEYHDKERTGEHVFLSVPKLDYKLFTVAVHLRPDADGKASYPLLIGAEFGGWIELEGTPGGGLRVSFNDGAAGFAVPDVVIKTGEWMTLAVSLDLKARRVAVYVNGRSAARMVLPPDFKLNVLERDVYLDEKAWSFTDYGSGRTFKGLVNELVVYNQVLLDVQVEDLKFNTRLPNKTP